MHWVLIENSTLKRLTQLYLQCIVFITITMYNIQLESTIVDVPIKTDLNCQLIS